MSWFFTRRILPGVWVIAEPQHVYCWLVEGTERAVLLDTGLGFERIRPVAERLTRQPITVANTHYHFDHVGGNWEFDDIAIHQLGAPLIAVEPPREVLDAYIDYAERQLEAARTYRELDREFFWLLTAENDPRPFPAEFEPALWRIRPSMATRTLVDGDSVDLGRRVLEVIHTPGHSPDGISLFEVREGLLFAGDAFNAGPIYAHFPDSDLAALGNSSRMLAELADSINLIMVHHYGRPLAESALLLEYAEALEQVQAGEIGLLPGRDVLDTPMLEARFDHFTITLPDPQTPQPPSLAGTTTVAV